MRQFPVELKHKRQKLYIALEDVDFVWDEREVKVFDQMWSEGFSIERIAKALKRSDIDVTMLVLDRRLQGKIQVRKHGIFGDRRGIG